MLSNIVAFILFIGAVAPVVFMIGIIAIALNEFFKMQMRNRTQIGYWYANLFDDDINLYDKEK